MSGVECWRMSAFVVKRKYNLGGEITKECETIQAKQTYYTAPRDINAKLRSELLAW